jgi:hypothetical protein
LPEEPSLFFERVVRLVPTVPDFFVAEVRLEAAAVRDLAAGFEAEPFADAEDERVPVERDAVPPVERPEDFVSDDFAPDDFVPADLVPDDFVPDDLVPELFAAERVPVDLAADALVPEDFVAEDFVAEDFVAEDLAPDDFVPADFVPAALVPEDFAADAFGAVDFVDEALAPEALAPEASVPPAFASELLVPADFVEELFAPPLERALVAADVPALFRAVVEDFDEPLRERLPLPLEDELPPVLSLLVFDLSSVGICRLLLWPSRSTATLPRQRR